MNQSVLLAGINDDADILCELSNHLFEIDVLPYYLHLLDRTRGTAHFEVDEHRAGQIYQDLLGQLPGYLVPKLVRDNAGENFKQLAYF